MAGHKGIRTENFEKVEVASRDEVWQWLEARHDQEASIWLVTFKKSKPEKYVSREEVLDALIAYGWTDGLRRQVDESRTMQLISPRRQQAWAKTYKDRAERLEREGRMADPGREAIRRSKALGLWNASDPIDALTIPDDLASALKGEPAADEFFNGAAPSYRRNVLRWIAAAKKPETRAKRIATAVNCSAQGQKVPQM